MKGLALGMITLCITATGLFSQNVAINNDGSAPDTSAILDIQSTTKGVLLPRLDSLQRLAISNAATGLLVFDTDTESFWFKQVGGWVELVNNAEGLRDCDMDTRIEVESAPDEDKIRFTVSEENVATLDSRTLHLESPNQSVSVGKSAGKNDISVIGANVFVGHEAGMESTTGISNTAVGYQSMHLNTQGFGNNALGYNALRKNSTGNNNTALGYLAMLDNNSGSRNIGIGRSANGKNQHGSHNTIVGYEAGLGSTAHSKSGNVFLGYQAGKLDTSDNKLYIENSDSDSPLIYGDFTNGEELVGINGKLGVGTHEPDFAFHIEEDGTADSVQTVVALLRSVVSKRPVLKFGENNLNVGMGIEYNGAAGTTTQNELYINNTDGIPITTFENGGNVGIGLSAPAAKLHIDNGSDAAISGGGFVILGDPNTKNIALDDNEIMARNNGVEADLFINNEGGRVGIGVSSANISDRLHVNSAAGQSALRVQVNGSTKLRVQSNGGTAIGANVTPPPNGLHIEGDLEINGDDIDADGTLRINSPTKIELIVGSSVVTVESTGITISSNSSIHFAAGGNITMSADGMIDLDAGTELELNASTTMDLNSLNGIDITGGNVIDIDGSLITLNSGGASAARVGSNVSGGQVTTGSSTVLIGN